MSEKPCSAVAVIGIDIGKNSFHVVGHDDHGAIVLRQKWSRSQVEARFANMPRCLIGMEACVGGHHLRHVADGEPLRSSMLEGAKDELCYQSDRDRRWVDVSALEESR